MPQPAWLKNTGGYFIQAGTNTLSNLLFVCYIVFQKIKKRNVSKCITSVNSTPYLLEVSRSTVIEVLKTFVHLFCGSMCPLFTIKYYWFWNLYFPHSFWSLSNYSCSRLFNQFLCKIKIVFELKRQNFSQSATLRNGEELSRVTKPATPKDRDNWSSLLFQRNRK